MKIRDFTEKTAEGGENQRRIQITPRNLRLFLAKLALRKKEVACWRILPALMGILLFVGPGWGVGVLFAGYQAQMGAGGNDDLWSAPRNLSQSGAASAPRLVVDANDVWHLIWREDAAGSFFYARREDGAWQAPLSLELPFAPRDAAAPGDGRGVTLYDPYLLADGNNRIYAFWLDNENRLLSSNVPAGEFELFSSWSAPEELAAPAVDFTVTVDEESNIHLSYARNVDSPEAPAGIYYRRLDGQTLAWSPAALVYNAAYYRAGAREDAALGMATAVAVITDSVALTDTVGSDLPGRWNVLLAGNNPVVEQLFLFRAMAGSDGWAEPLLVDARKVGDSPFSVGPSQPAIASQGDEVLLAWQAGHQTECELYYQWSDDGGTAWTPPAVFPSGQQGCPEEYQLFRDANGLFFLLTFWGEEAFLQAWNGAKWSEPQRQFPLTGFTDPVTRRQINLGCRQTAVTRENRLVVAGCGSGPANDVWVLERPLGEEAVWFPPPERHVWSKPALLFESSEVQISSPVLLPGADSSLYAFWIGAEQGGSEPAGDKIYYARWDNQSWSQPVPLFTLDTPFADQLQGVIGKNGNISLVWRDPETNSYYVKQVDKQQVQFPADWSATQELAGAEMYMTRPALFAGKTAVGAVFATPLNENRGLYWLRDIGAGETQANPEPVFDAAAAGWEMVDKPRLVQTGDGAFHVALTRYKLLPGPEPDALYYMRLPAGESGWSEPELVARGDIGWSEIVGLGEETLLVIWQQFEADRQQILFQQSFDSGQTWDDPFLFLTLPVDGVSSPLIVQDQNNNQLHFIYVAAGDNAGERVLHEHLWQGGRWQMPEAYILSDGRPEEALDNITGAKSPDGALTLLYGFNRVAEEDKSDLFFTRRLYELPESGGSPQPEPTGTPAGETTAVSTPQPLPAPTAAPTANAPLPDASPAQPETEFAPVTNRETTSSFVKIAVGLLPVLFITGGVALFSWMRIRRGRRR